MLAREVLSSLVPALCGIRGNSCFACQQGLHVHHHMLPLINSTPSEAALRFGSRLCVSKVIGHHIVPPTCMSRQPYLRSQSASLPPLSASILASPQRPHSLRCTHAHARTDTQTFAPAAPAHTPLPSHPRSPPFSRVFPSLSATRLPKGAGFCPISGTN